MRNFNIIEAVTNSGSNDRPNEDCFGFNDDCAFVIDGATGLGQSQIMLNADSDAAWLAEFASHYISLHLGAFDEIETVLERLIRDARSTFFLSTADMPVPRYAWPSASIAILRIGEEAIEFSGLGDCLVYIENDNGVVGSYSALENFSDWENAQAAKHIQRIGGIEGASLLDDNQTLEILRTQRALQNTRQSNIWTLGLVPQAAQQIEYQRIDRPAATAALICSDGFSALVETYRAYTPATLLAAAKTDGIAKLMRELRQIENVVDPNATQYPRFKKSDDATAVLLEIS